MPDASAEVTALIEKHIKKNRVNGYVWYMELGKDLVNYLARPEFIKAVLLEVSRNYTNPLMYGTAAGFAEALNSSQIQLLLGSKPGMMLINSVQGYLSFKNVSQYITTSAEKFTELYMKIERVRIPVVVGDKRPYVGDMVGASEDLGLDPSTSGENRIPFSNRFGSGHDGEHWLTNTVGAQVKATNGIKGTVLTYYAQNASFTIWNMMILLDNTRIVMLIKDLTSLGQAVLKAPKTGTGTGKLQIIDSKGNPISKVKINVGEIIGTTMSWKPDIAAKYYSSYDRTFGSFHFAFLKYEFAQQYRSKAPNADGVADDEAIATLSPEQRKTTALIKWFVPVLGPESPVKCFK